MTRSRSVLDTSTSFAPGQCADARADVHGDPTDVVATDLALAGVQPGAHLDAERLHRVADRHGAADRSLRTVEHRQKAVTRRAHLTAPKPSELRPHDGVVRIEQRMPVTVADLRRPARRVDDVGEKHGGEDPVVGHVGLVAGEEFGDLLKGLTPRFDEVVDVAPRQLNVLRARYVVGDVLAQLGRDDRSSACWTTRVGTRIVGSRGRTSNSATRGIMRATVPGLAARRSVRAQLPEFPRSTACPD